MKYTQEGENVTLEMTVEDYGNLMLMLGRAAGSFTGINRSFYSCLGFVNELNTGNPNFTPYEIPAEFAKGTKP